LRAGVSTENLYVSSKARESSAKFGEQRNSHQTQTGLKRLDVSRGSETIGCLTRAEIFQQPDLWPNTFERVAGTLDRFSFPSDCPCVISGAGSSAYAALAIQAAFPTARAVPSTDLLVDVQPFGSGGILVSLARSGDSPESAAVIRRVQRLFPEVRHFAITCNADGQLARFPGVTAIILDPRTNDRSLAMTSSFSNLVLAGLCLRHSREIGAVLPDVCRRVKENLPSLDAKAQGLAGGPVSRVAILASAPMMGWAQEASLKILEMSAGRVPVLVETHLGLRHGPMSFLRPDTLVVSLLSSDPLRRRYEKDLIEELRSKGLGRIIVIRSEESPGLAFGETVPAMAAELPDNLRTPFEIVFPQLLAYHLSVHAGLNPDNPSPGGVITRVVQGVRIHEG
jgi:D-galactosamine 6-phosphate deaminase/isomerase